MSELFGSAEAGDYSLADLDDLSQAQTTFDTGSDEQAEANIQSVLANVGNRSNIRGSVNYDPLFAQALNMSNRLQPGNLVAGDYYGANKFQGIADLARPSYLQPQIRGADGKMYFSKGEELIQNMPPIGVTGILQNLINYGTKKFNETFGNDKKEEKSDVGIMENMDRADMSDFQKAVVSGYENNPFSGPATQTAFNLKDVLTSPGMINRGLNFVQPYLQEMVPDNVEVSTDPRIDRKEGTVSPQIQFKIPIEDNTLGLGSLFNLG
jgi:hypothetical protein|tara:strand:+ start:571 stop:1368 length:798 start_codon:yes stop_codon:yes gene_type:complete